MTTLREAAQQALEALENGAIARPGWVPDYDDAITSLRAALAEQAQPERGSGWCDIHQHYKPCEHNTAEQAQPVAWAPMWAVDRLTGKLGGKADPVTWGLHAPLYARLPRHDAVALYTTPPAPVVPQPLTIERLRDALVASRVIPPEAIEDPDAYDDGVMLHRIEALFRRIA